MKYKLSVLLIALFLVGCNSTQQYGIDMDLFNNCRDNAQNMDCNELNSCIEGCRVPSKYDGWDPSRINICYEKVQTAILMKCK